MNIFFSFSYIFLDDLKILTHLIISWFFLFEGSHLRSILLDFIFTLLLPSFSESYILPPLFIPCFFPVSMSLDIWNSDFLHYWIHIMLLYHHKTSEKLNWAINYISCLLTIYYHQPCNILQTRIISDINLFEWKN
jgi:hypothetical protein